MSFIDERIDHVLEDVLKARNDFSVRLYLPSCMSPLAKLTLSFCSITWGAVFDESRSMNTSTCSSVFLITKFTQLSHLHIILLLSLCIVFIESFSWGEKTAVSFTRSCYSL